MPTQRFSMSESDSFEMRTDRMAAADAQTELLSRVWIARKVAGISRAEFRINYETTKDGFRRVLNVSPVEKPEATPDELRAHLFVAWRVLGEIEDMLAPKKNSFWRLHLKQRRTGQRKVPLAIAADIYESYAGSRVFESEKPSKAVIGDLAKEHGLPDTTIRGIVRRTRGKQRRKRARNQK